MRVFTLFYNKNKLATELQMTFGTPVRKRSTRVVAGVSLNCFAERHRHCAMLGLVPMSILIHRLIR